MKFSLIKSALVACAFSAAGAIAAPTPVAIVNSSFEADTTFTNNWPNTAWSPGILSGWTVTGSGGVWNVRDPAYYPGGAPDGVNVAYSNGGVISQTLASKLSNNTAYALSVAVGRRTDVPAADYTIELLAGGHVVASVTDPVVLTQGAFSTVNLNYTSGINDPFAGQELGIEFVTGGVQVNYDKVSLTANPLAPVPEPEHYAMLLAGLCLMGAALRRKQS